MAFAGNAHYVSSFIDYFKSRHDVITFVLLEPQVDFLATKSSSFPFHLIGPDLMQLGPWTFLVSSRSVARSVAWNVFSRLPKRLQAVIASARRRLRRASGFSHNLGRFRTGAEKRYVLDAITRLRPDLVIYDGIFNYCGVPEHGEPWMITHEIKHERVESFQTRGMSVLPLNFSREAEAAILQASRNLIAIQWDDADALRQLAPDANVVVVPASFQKPQLSADNRIISKRCVFVASASFHNVHGLRWFLDECWNEIRLATPDATLALFGSVGSQFTTLPEGVVDFGVIHDIGAAYTTAEVAIVPLLVGSGLKVKLIEAMMYEMPIVTTPIGAQGLMQLEPRPFILAYSASEFSKAIIQVLTDEELRISLRRRAEKASARFAPAAAFSELERHL